MTEPDMHEARVRIGHESGRGAERIALIVVALLAIAILKPWGSPSAAELAPPQPPVAEQPDVTPAETTDVADRPCNNHSWLVQVDMLWPRRLVRSWLFLDAVEASGPTDPRIPFVTVASPEVRAIGYCTALNEDIPSETRPTFYRLGPPVAVVATDQVADAENEGNVLYRPVAAGRSPSPSGTSPSPPHWEGGRYVLRIDGPSGFERWLGFEIRIVEDTPPA